MSRYTWITGGMIVLALALAVWTFTPSKPAVEAQEDAGPLTKAIRQTGSEQAKPARAKNAATLRRQANPVAAPAAAVAHGAGQAGTVIAKHGEPTASEKAVEAWDALIDDVAARTGPPTAEQAARFKEAFHTLDKADQMAGIQNALNLIPDEQFSLFNPILYDKAEDAGVLDEIFSDALNRDEAIKVPMMKELYKDKEHPMFVESARILDATGELDKMNSPGEPEEAKEK